MDSGIKELFLRKISDCSGPVLTCRVVEVLAMQTSHLPKLSGAQHSLEEKLSFASRLLLLVKKKLTVEKFGSVSCLSCTDNVWRPVFFPGISA